MARIETLYEEFKKWLDGERQFDDLDAMLQKAIDELVAEEEALEKGDPTVEDVHQGQANTPKPKRRKAPDSETPLDLIHKANKEQKFTLGPWYIPDKEDAHSEWTDAEELQKALWDYVRSGDRNIRLQHNTDIVAGEWVEAMSFPVPITLGMTKASGDAKQVTYPAGTVFLGVKWNDWAWDLVKQDKITGFSIGGSAARVEMGIPMPELTKSTRKEANRFVKDSNKPVDEYAVLKSVLSDHIAGNPVNLGSIDAMHPTVIKYKGVSYSVKPLSKAYSAGVFNVAGLYGDDDSVAIVRTDGERFWAVGSGVIPKLEYAKAQHVLAEVSKAARQSFGGNRSAAAQYAANVRWQGHRADTLGRGSMAEPKTVGGVQLGATAESLVTHCDLDAVAADMSAAGLKEPTPDMFYKHLSPERRAMWDAAIAEKVDPVPKNPDGPNAYMMGGGGASGKSSAIDSGIVSVPNADASKGALKAVDVNPDSAKEQIPSYKAMQAAKDPRGADWHHEESSQIAALTAAAGLKGGKDIVVDGVADNGAAKTMGKTDTFRALGAKRVELHVVTCDIDTAKARNTARFKKTGRLVDEGALVAGHKGVSKNFPEYAKSGKWDIVTVLDTNTRPPTQIFKQSKGGKPTVSNKKAYQDFLDKQNYGA